MSSVHGDTAFGRSGPKGRSVDATASAERHRRRRRELWLLLAVLLLAVLIHFPTYLSMTNIWWRSQTFVHGVLIMPISAYLVWQRWPVLRSIDLQPWYPGLLGVLGATLCWWIANELNLQVGKQFMVVALWPLLVATLAGIAFARAIAFPLGYLVFAVPFGEGVIPYLIEFTAYFTVEALEITGFPVFREGPFFSIPAGDFEVAKACSGIRYLLASLALGTLYGYLIFNSLKKRLAFFALALLLPIAANGLRAYAIVLLAHYSGMQLAVGVDHIIFGWIFFGIVMLLMFWIGDRFRDRPLADAALERKAPAGPEGADTSLRRFAPATGLALLLVAAGPSLSMVLPAVETQLAPAALPAEPGRWRAAAPADDWQPAYENATWSLRRRYLRDGEIVDLAVVRYDVQEQHAELANADNVVADGDVWRFGQAATRRLELADGTSVPVQETFIHRAGANRIVWSIAEVNAEPVASHFETKWKEASHLLSFRPVVAAAIILSAPAARDETAARRSLENFLADSWSAIHDCLYAQRANRADCVSAPDKRDDGAGDAPAAGER